MEIHLINKMNKKYRTAIIGLGQIGFTIESDKTRNRIWAHSEAYSKHACTSLIAGADISEELCSNFKKVYPQAEVYQSYKDMLIHEEIDILSICVHEDICIDILDYVLSNHASIKAIFCEKPIAKNSESIKKIVEKSEEKEVSICVNYFRRWEEPYNICKDLITSKKFGNLKTIIGLGTTALRTSSSHILDVLISFNPEIETIYSIKQEDYVRRANNKEDPGYSVLMSCANDSNIFLKSTSKNPENFSFEIILLFDDAKVLWRDGVNSIDIYEHSIEEEYIGKGYSPISISPKKIDFSQTETMLEAISEMVSSLEGSINLSSNIYNAYEVVKTMELIDLSASKRNLIHIRKNINEK
jgi:predicted dehydrogenase